MRLRRSLLPLGCCLLLPALAHGTPPPASAYADPPLAATGRLSPNGKSITFINGNADNSYVVVGDVDSGKTNPIPADQWNPQWVHWKDDKTLLASIEQTTMLEDGVPAPGTRLVAIAADGSNAKAVVFDRNEATDADVYGDTGNLVPNIQDDLISDLSDHPDHILVEIPYKTYVYPSIFDVNLWNGDKRMQMGDFRNVVTWSVDQNDVPRAGITYIDRGSSGNYESHILARASANDDWHTLAFNADELAFSATDPNALYAIINSPRRLVQLDISTGAIKQDIVDGAVSMMVHNGIMIGYTVTDASGDNHSTYTDPGWAADAATIAGALKLSSVVLIDRSTDGKRVTALVAKNNHPTVLWLLDRTPNPANLAPLLTNYSDVPDDQIAPTHWTSFKARDGLEIPLLVTLPVNAPKGPIPFVVLPHGGPTSRDDGGFDWLAQFIASRGYGVLQPQFRGSDGFGADFRNKGRRQWGLAMQDDVTDATKWLVDQNLADPKKICIVGGSYGGYAALEGAVKEPTLYACAAAIAPVTDLPAFIQNQRDFAFSDSNIPAIGDDIDVLEATSPDRHADRVQIPILLIHGNKDYTVSVQQTQKMEAALKAAGKTEQTIYLPNADHYFPHPADRLAILNALQTFLGQNLGPASP